MTSVEEYAEYLRSPTWQTIRRLKLEEAGHRCQLCNGVEGLSVHHRTYDRRGRERLDDLFVFCDPCHKKFHGILPSEPQAEASPPIAKMSPEEITAAMARIAQRQREIVEWRERGQPESVAKVLHP